MKLKSKMVKKKTERDRDIQREGDKRQKQRERGISSKETKKILTDTADPEAGGTGPGRHAALGATLGLCEADSHVTVAGGAHVVVELHDLEHAQN